MKIAVMGAGGQGCFFWACLAKAGNDVTFIARGVTLEARVRERALRGEVYTSCECNCKIGRIGIS